MDVGKAAKQIFVDHDIRLHHVCRRSIVVPVYRELECLIHPISSVAHDRKSFRLGDGTFNNCQLTFPAWFFVGGVVLHDGNNHCQIS